MILPAFELHHPTRLPELLELCRTLRAEGRDFDFVAGGTDVLPNYKNRLNPKGDLISLARLEGFDEIETNRIGARARIADLATSSVLGEHWPGLVEAARSIASPTLRNLGTVGGNLCLDTRCHYFNQSEFWRRSKGYCLKADGEDCLVVPQKKICYATYSGDLAPVFLVLDAVLDLAGPQGERSMPLREFYAFDGIRRFRKEPDEICLRIRIPKESEGLRTGYRKLRARDVLEYPVMGVAMGLRVAEGAVRDLRVAVTGSEAIPLHYGDLDLGNGIPPGEEGAEAVKRALLEWVKTYRNVPFPPGYRRAMAGEFGRELFMTLVSA